METKAAAIAATPDVTTGTPPVASVRKVPAAPESTIADNAADLRLIIERDDNTGRYIYTTINRRTGEVVQRLPREEILRMGDGDLYARGRVIDTSA